MPPAGDCVPAPVIGLPGAFHDGVLDTVTEFPRRQSGSGDLPGPNRGTLAELAEAEGSTGAALEAELVGVVQQRVDEAIAAGKIGVERGAEIIENATERIDEIVYEVHTPGRGR